MTVDDIGNILAPYKWKPFEPKPANELFFQAYTRKALGAHYHFFIIDARERRVNIDNTKERVRKWWYGGSRGIFADMSGCNNIILILHKGDYHPEDVKNQVDQIGGYAKALIVAVVILNVDTGEMHQDRTWSMLGFLKKSLNDLQQACDEKARKV